MKKKFLFLLGTPLPLISLSAVSCYSDFDYLDNGPSKIFNIKKTKFINLSSKDYSIKNKNLNLYFLDNKIHQPYVAIEEMLGVLNGFVDTSLIRKKPTYDINATQLVSNNQLMYIDADRDIISVSNEAFFNFVKQSNLTNYSRFISYEGSKIENINDLNGPIKFDLRSYHIDIFKEGRRTFIPLSIFNTLFCSQNYYNLYYNGDAVYGKFFSLMEDENDAYSYQQGSWSADKETTQDRIYNLDNLLFTLDNFYGLKSYKNISNFQQYIGDIKKELLSNNPDIYNKAYAKLFFNKLNDLHTRINMLNIFTNNSKKINDYASKLYGTERSEYAKVNEYLEQKRAILEQKIKQDGFIINGNLAYIIIDNFETASNNEIYAKNIKSDTFEFLRNTLQKILKQKNIKNVVIDISRNGGGNIGAMYRAVGLLTNKDIVVHSKSLLSGIIETQKYKIDANKDGNYYDNDAFENFNYYILTSKNTFSAANTFSGIIKELKVAKIIGQKSGGGTAPVLPLVLNDGTSISTSSPLNYLYKHHGSEINLEDGVKPDIEIPYNNFYDIDYLTKILPK
ncbi:S41 family peptidase [Mycoplasma sp. 125]|uniref:S41 family peptidase n=1 Tax=Mycoplasma sp. 125 TaxID=3447505 RepID=UPI003F654D8B